MKVGRNDKCPCGSGKKYKKCCINKDQKSLFIITKEVYERDFLPVYNIEEYEPQIIIEYNVVLPFHIPMYIGNTITISSEQGYFSFRFDMVATNDSYKYPVGDESSILNINKTKILMIAAVDLNDETLFEDKERYYNIYGSSVTCVEDKN